MIRLALLALCCTARADTPHIDVAPGAPIPLREIGGIIVAAVGAAAGAWATSRRQPQEQQATTMRAAVAIEQSAATLDSTAAVLARLDERTEHMAAAQDRLEAAQVRTDKAVRVIHTQHQRHADALSRLLVRQGETPIAPPDEIDN